VGIPEIMQSVNVNNKKLKKILYDYSEFILQEKYRTILDSEYYYGALRKPYEKGLTEDYLNHVRKYENKHNGFPEAIRGMELKYEFNKKSSLSSEHDILRKELMKIAYDTTTEINRLLVTKRNALCCYYPDDGYITWHNNQNASGHNVIFSYSEKGTGSFSYLDPELQEIVNMPDPIAEWTCKVGYFGKYSEPDKVFWHKAESGGSRRITVAFVIPSNPLWEEMINDIESP